MCILWTGNSGNWIIPVVAEKARVIDTLPSFERWWLFKSSNKTFHSSVFYNIQCNKWHFRIRICIDSEIKWILLDQMNLVDNKWWFSSKKEKKWRNKSIHDSIEDFTEKEINILDSLVFHFSIEFCFVVMNTSWCFYDLNRWILILTKNVLCKDHKKYKINYNSFLFLWFVNLICK